MSTDTDAPDGVPARLVDLAPTDLVIYRELRYTGEGVHTEMKAFAPEDGDRVRLVYERVKGLYELWLADKDDPDWDAVRAALRRFTDGDFLDMVRAIGEATYEARRVEPLFRKVVHDIRAGALSVLIGYTQLVEYEPDDENLLRTAVFLARDHAKMMRNGIIDIDKPVRDADESVTIHAVSDICDKWDHLTYHTPDGPVDVTVDSHFDGDISNRCLETSSIDRILYNYLNNAARFAAGDEVKLTIFPISPGIVRWVTQNPVRPDHVAWLRDHVGDDLRRLFKEPITRGGTGIGLTTCADFIAASFGLDDPWEAVDRGYLGAAVVDDVYHAWFHWPAYHPDHDDRIVADLADAAGD